MDILYIDEFIAVINKPSGLLSVPVPGKRTRTAQESLEQFMRKSGRYKANHRPAAVHRLDRDTSGVMMFALTKPIQKQIMDNWKKVVTQRIYHAVCENPKNSKQIAPEGVIDSPLAFNKYNVAYVPKPSEKKETVSAITNYKILKQGRNFTLFELELDTGRKNQIRAHLSSIGYTICGDVNYRAKTNKFGRLALHARVLEFIHPITKEKLRFEIPENESWSKI